MRIILSLLPLLLMVATVTAAEPPKNIVLILADDLGWADTTLYGKTSLYETPNIERLAARLCRNYTTERIFSLLSQQNYKICSLTAITRLFSQTPDKISAISLWY